MFAGRMNKLSQKCFHLDFLSADCHNDCEGRQWKIVGYSVCGQSKRIHELGVLSVSNLSRGFRAFTVEILIPKLIREKCDWYYGGSFSNISEAVFHKAVLREQDWKRHLLIELWKALIPCSPRFSKQANTLGNFGKVEEHLCNASMMPQKLLLSAHPAADSLTQLSGRTSCDEIFGKQKLSGKV